MNMATTQATAPAAPVTKPTRQELMAQQREIQNNSLSDADKHLAVKVNEKQVQIGYNLDGGPDKFGWNDNNRRAYETLAAAKGRGTDKTRVHANQVVTQTDDSEIADPINPTKGEQAHIENDVKVAQVTRAAVIDGKPITTGRVGTPDKTGKGEAGPLPNNTGNAPATPAAASQSTNSNVQWGKNS
jgi:hypothetical protein